MNKILLSLLCCLCISMHGTAQELKSPEQYLGYPIGAHYTRHQDIVGYFHSVAMAAPGSVQLLPYGKTNEGRELLALAVSSPDNIKKLESIRKNNLRLAGLLADGLSPDTANAPVIVWLSYNVHGNEPSSSEAAMQTLFALVNPSNLSAASWLKHTVVILDPCINPDGRDRYVNWFNSVVGASPNPDPASREHAEPWPGGRTNHYNFDLNRDWAWQTQIETRHRMQLYNEWLPQVHVDFHEQGINEPYYFAPAASPYHLVITPWQRRFQEMIGKNNARYFDEKGWLFFTKERFDLLYPSYGDTYPLYNGAIGMTFEQGGGSRGGLAVIKGDGDTLTLYDRLIHHYTTGMSTVETSADNRGELLSQFATFYRNSNNGQSGGYATYVLTDADENKIRSVVALLEKNGIRCGKVDQNHFQGYNYFSGKTEAYEDLGYQVAISAYQPKSVLARVLLEPKTTVVDSNTYDITAWSIPYVYGIRAYGVTEKLPVTLTWSSKTEIQPVSSDYGLLVPYHSFQAARLLAELLRQGIKVRFAEKPFTYNKVHYDRGTLIILKTGNPANWNNISNETCRKYMVQPVAVSTGMMDEGPDFGSPSVRVIGQAPKVAMLTGEQVSSGSAGEVWHLFEKELKYPITLLNAAELSRLSLKDFQVLILPDGSYRSLREKPLIEKMKEFVRSGGKLIAMENAVSALANAEWGIHRKEDSQDEKKSDSLPVYGNQETDALTHSLPGAIYKLDIDNTHPMAFGYPAYYYTLKTDTQPYQFLKDGWNVGTLDKDGYTAGFVGAAVQKSLTSGLVFGVDEMGSGSVVYLTEDPLFRDFWENGKLLFCNAVFLVGN